MFISIFTCNKAESKWPIWHNNVNVCDHSSANDLQLGEIKIEPGDSSLNGITFRWLWPFKPNCSPIS